MHDRQSAVTVSSEANVSVPCQTLWARLSRAESVPGTITGGVEGRVVRFLHTGASGWLPVKSLSGELRLEPAGDGTRVSLSLTADVVAAGFAPVVRQRLASYVESSLAARLRAA